MSHVYTCALNMDFTSLIFHARAGYVTSIFRNVLSRVVASHMCSQVLIELYHMHIQIVFKYYV